MVGKKRLDSKKNGVGWGVNTHKWGKVQTRRKGPCLEGAGEELTSKACQQAQNLKTQVHFLSLSSSCCVTLVKG